MTRGFAHSLVLLGLLAGPMARAAEPEEGGAPSVDAQPSEEEAPAQRRGSLAPGQTLVDGRVLVDEGWQVRWAPPEGWLALGADASDHVNPLAIGMLRNLTPLEGGALGSGGFLTALPDAVTEDRSPSETWMTRYPNADDVVMQEVTHEGLDGWEIRFRLARHDSVQVHLVTVVPRVGHILAVQTFVPAGRSDLDALHAQSVEGLSFLDGEIVPPERGRTVLDVNRSGFRVQDGWFEHPGLGVRMRVPAPWSLMLPGALRAAGHDSVVGAISRSQRVNFFLTLSGEEEPEGFLARLRTVVESRDAARWGAGRAGVCPPRHPCRVRRLDSGGARHLELQRRLPTPGARPGHGAAPRHRGQPLRRRLRPGAPRP